MLRMSANAADFDSRFSEVLGRGAADNQRTIQHARESKRMKKLVEDLLLLAKLDRKPELHLQETRLDQLAEMEPHLRMLAQGRSVAIQTIPLLCRCDPDKIKQVIYNLFHNAVQHTDSTTGQITVSANKTKDQVVLLVADNGAGFRRSISPSVRALLPYRRIPDQTVWWCGSWIVHYPIHHFRAWGQMNVDSKVNQGTVFVPSGRASVPSL